MAIQISCRWQRETARHWRLSRSQLGTGQKSPRCGEGPVGTGASTPMRLSKKKSVLEKRSKERSSKKWVIHFWPNSAKRESPKPPWTRPNTISNSPTKALVQANHRNHCVDNPQNAAQGGSKRQLRDSPPPTRPHRLCLSLCCSKWRRRCRPDLRTARRIDPPYLSPPGCDHRPQGARPAHAGDRKF